MARLVKSLLHKCGHGVQNPGVVEKVLNWGGAIPVMGDGRQRQADPCSSLAGWPGSLLEVPGQGETVSEKRWKVPEERPRNLTFDLYRHGHPHSHTCQQLSRPKAMCAGGSEIHVNPTWTGMSQLN